MAQAHPKCISETARYAMAEALSTSFTTSHLYASSTLSNGPPHSLCTFTRVEVLPLLAVHDLGRLLHDLLALGKDELDVAGVGPFSSSV